MASEAKPSSPAETLSSTFTETGSNIVIVTKAAATGPNMDGFVASLLAMTAGAFSA
jgi:hypothetical protein